MTANTNPQVVAALTEVPKMLAELLDQTKDVSVDNYVQPVAEDVLTWAIGEVQTMISRHAGS